MNNPETRPSDADIAAWLDGMLDKDGAAAMTELAASNESVATRAQRLRHIDELVRSAVPAEEEVPSELLERLGLVPTASAGNVVNLAAAREERSVRTTASGAANDNGRWWRVAAQVALVVGLGIGFVSWNAAHHIEQESALYRALSDAARPQAKAADALVVFTPGVNAAQARNIVGSAGGTLVGQPNDAGAWKMTVPSARRDQVLATLRADARVTMAEAIEEPLP